MTFEEILDQVIAMLQRRERISYRALKRQFDLDDDYIEDLKKELIYAQRVAVDEEGRVLVWTGKTATKPASASPSILPATTQERAPLAYTPKHLTEKVLTTRSALEGERKQVTVLFADIADSSGLAQQLDAEVMHQLLDRVLRIMAEAIHRYEGTVN